MELVELSTTSLAEAMFEKLGLAKPAYRVYQLEQGGYHAQVQFHHSKEPSCTCAQQMRLSGPVCQDREIAKNRAADLAIEYMETMEKKVLVDYNYYQLEQQKKAFARASTSLLEKSENIRQHSKTIKEMTREAGNFVEIVRSASKKIHDLTDISSEPAASIYVDSLKKVLLEIRDAVFALQNTTETTYLSLHPEEMSPYEDVSDTGYIGFSGEGSDEDYHQDMDDDYAHYVRSP